MKDIIESNTDKPLIMGVVGFSENKPFKGYLKLDVQDKELTTLWSYKIDDMAISNAYEYRGKLFDVSMPTREETFEKALSSIIGIKLGQDNQVINQDSIKDEMIIFANYILQKYN